MSDSRQPHGLQHPRLPCPSPMAGACSNSCPSSQWSHPTISSSVVPFSFCLRSFLASESFQMSQLFASGGQSIGVSASASVLPMNIQDWFPSGLAGLISLQSKGLSRVFSNTTFQKHQFFSAQLYSPTLTSMHDYWKKNIALIRWTFVAFPRMSYNKQSSQIWLSSLRVPSCLFVAVWHIFSSSFLPPLISS